MRKVFFTLIVLTTIIYALETAAMPVAKCEINNRKVYIDSVIAIADSLYSKGNKNQCFKHLKSVLDFYSINQDELIKNDEVCRTIFDAYSFYNISENPISIEERIENLGQALNIIELNSNWIKSYPNKQHIINLYITITGYLIEIGNINEAQKANQGMLKFAEHHYKLGLPDVILSACSMNSLMGNFDLNIPLYEKLYGMFDELDKLQQYKVVKELIHFEFNANNYSEVINLATKHTKLIQWANDEVKDSILDLISLSFEKTAFKIEDATSTDRYSVEVNDAFLTGYNWTKVNNKAFLPRSIIYWGYYKYKWDNARDEAIALFYEFLDLLQNKDIDEPIFDAYCEIEDAQQAIISIIVTQIMNASTPIDIESFITKYDRVFYELIGSKKGQYYNDLINAIETSYMICYGK